MRSVVWFGRARREMILILEGAGHSSEPVGKGNGIRREIARHRADPAAVRQWEMQPAGASRQSSRHRFRWRVAKRSGARRVAMSSMMAIRITLPCARSLRRSRTRKMRHAFRTGKPEAHANNRGNLRPHWRAGASMARLSAWRRRAIRRYPSITAARTCSCSSRSVTACIAFAL